MLKNILIVVSDVERSKRFYQEVFGLCVVNDFGDNVILTEGLVLQEQKSWEQLIESDMVTGNASERENSWGKRIVMLQDPDGHLIEEAER